MIKIIIGMLFVLNAQAQVLNLSPAQEWTYGVNLNYKGNFDGVNLPLTGWGLGTKKVGVTRVKIAVNEFFTQFPTNMVRTDAGVLQSLSNVGIMGMRISFLRSLDTVQLHDFVQSYIEANLTPDELRKYDNDIQNVTNAIESDSYIPVGRSIVFVLIGDKIYYQNTQGNVILIYTNTSFLVKLMSVWFGKCPDDDCYNLKMNLLNVPKVTPQTSNKPLYIIDGGPM